MLKSLKSLARDRRGMTLIEIMIVLAIIGGIAAVIGTKVVDNLKKARVKQARLQMTELSKALDMFYSDCGFYPAGDGGLKALLEASPECKNWGPEPYIKPNMVKDPWNGEFIYENSGSGYVLKSLGNDRKEGGSGFDADISSADL